MNPSNLSAAPEEQRLPSVIAQRLQQSMVMTSDRKRSLLDRPSQVQAPGSGNSMVIGPEQFDLASRQSMPEVANMGALVHMDVDTRMQAICLDKFVNRDGLIYPFEVNVTLTLPKLNDFMWDFKHNFFFSIMYSQVYRYFFPFNRHNSQLFFVTNEHQPEDPLQCVNIPSRIMFRSMRLDMPLENILVAAISAYKDYMAFFRLSSKHQPCQEPYKNFCYVPPVWTNKLD